MDTKLKQIICGKLWVGRRTPDGGDKCLWVKKSVVPFSHKNKYPTPLGEIPRTQCEQFCDFQKVTPPGRVMLPVNQHSTLLSLPTRHCVHIIIFPLLLDLEWQWWELCGWLWDNEQDDGRSKGIWSLDFKFKYLWPKQNGDYSWPTYNFHYNFLIFYIFLFLPLKRNLCK